MHTKYRFATAVAVIGLAVSEFGFGAVPAADVDAGDGTAGNTSASSSSESLQEILVTAERMSVDVMHAPVSMTAINGDDLQRNEIHNTTDLQFYVPGLAVANQVLNTGINIRGIGLGFALPNAAQGVPVYRDNLLVPPNAGDEPLWDIASVQVLRGPQGTLVGANSTGGAMFINSVRPSLGDSHGYAQVQGGSYDHLNVQAAINLPVADTLAARVGMYYEKRDSFSENLSPLSATANAGIPNWQIRKEPGNLNMTGARGSLLWQPNDRIQVVGRVDFFRSLSDYAAEKPIAITSTSVNGVLTNCPAPGSFFNTDPTTWGTVPSACGNAPFAPADPYQLAYAVDTTAMNERVWRESVDANFQLTEAGLTLRVLAGAAFNTLEFKNQHSASTNLTLAGGAPIHENTQTYEADLISPTQGPLTWVLGAFDWFNPAKFAYRGTVYSGGPVGVGPGYAVPQGGFFLDFKSVKHADALFGNVSYDITSDLKAEFGVRKTWNHNTAPFQPCASCPGGNSNNIYFGGQNPVNPLGPVIFSAYGDPNAAGGFQPNQGEEKDSFLTWKAALNYNFNPTNYVYGFVATGGKAGGISAQPGMFGQNFSPEKDADFELGWKSTQLDGHATLQLNAFYTRYTNMQISDLNPQTGAGRVHNAGATKLHGLEFTGAASVANWQLNATASYTKSSFDIGSEGIINQDICALYAACNNAQGQCPPGVANGTNGCFDYNTGGLSVNGQFYPWLERVNGLQLPNSPKFQYNVAVGYDLNLANGDALTPRIGYSYQGTQYAQIYNTPFDSLPARHNLDAKLGYVHEEWYVEMYATNVTGKTYPLAQNDADAQIYNPPRQYGARVSQKVLAALGSTLGITMADFSPSHSLSGFFSPTRFEADILDCVVTGAIPKDLNGAFYRMHGDWLYPPKFLDEASLSADGYISMFRFRSGSVDYRGRYVRTDRYNRQVAARRQLYGYYRNPHTDDPQVRDLANPGRRTAANTTPVILAGNLYATKEEGLPYQIEPNTLDTLGPTDFGGTWKSQTFTAHPKFDPATGETLAYGYEASGLASRDVYLCSFDRSGKITWEVRFDVPYPSMLHDMVLSKDYVMIPGGGTITSPERLASGRPHWGWDSKRPSYYAVIARGGSAKDIRWFHGPERSIVHTANAWNDDNVLTVDAPVADGNTWPWFEDIHGAPFAMNGFTIRRLTFDLHANNPRPREEVLFEQDVTSFTRVDDRLTAQPNRYIFVQYADASKPFEAHLPNDPRLRPVNSFGRFNVIDRTMQPYFVGSTHILQEPTFVPRSPDAAEGDGYLLGTAHNLAEMRSELVIVDASTMQECARVILPFRNAQQVHGVWASPADLPLL